MTEPTRAGRGCQVAAWSFALMCGALAFVGLRLGSPGMMVLFSILALVAIGLLLRLLLGAHQESMVEVELAVSPLQPAFGEAIHVTARVFAKRQAPLTRGRIYLRCTERAINRGGTSDTTYTHVAYEDVRPVEAEQVLMESSAWTAEVDLTAPLGLPASYAGQNNFIEWVVGFDMGLRGPTLDIRRTQPISVRGVQV